MSLSVQTPGSEEPLISISEHKVDQKSQLPTIPETNKRLRLNLEQDMSSSDTSNFRNYQKPNSLSQNNRSNRTPQAEEPPEEIIPQVRHLMRKNTGVSQVSNKITKGFSRLQSLQSSRPARVYPEELFRSESHRHNSQLVSDANDSFLDEFEPQESHREEHRFRYDKRYSSVRFIIYPDDQLKQVWDAIVFSTLIYVCFVLPFAVAFQGDDISETEELVLFDIGMVVDIIYGMDMILNFFTAYQDQKDELVVKHTEIARNYLTGWFLFDLICIMPFETILSDTQGQWQKLTRLPKVYKLVRLIRISRVVKFILHRNKYSDMATNFSNNQNIRIMILSLMSVLFVSHLIACLWYFVGVYDSSGWVNQYIAEERQTFERYIISFYWVFSTMATTGYGDVAANNSTEQLLNCIIMVFGVAFFSVTIGSVSSLLTQLDSQNLRYKEKLDVLNEIAAKYQIDGTLYFKINKVLRRGYKNNQNEELELLSHLPQNLRTELSQAMYENVLAGIDFFRSKPPRFTAFIGPLLSVYKLAEGDVVYNQGDYSNEMFFIKEGQVQFCMKEYDYQPFYTLMDGKHFGEFELINEKERQHTVIAHKDCELLSLNKQNFYKIFFSEFKEIGQELHEASRKLEKMLMSERKKLLQVLQNMERQSRESSPLKPPPIQTPIQQNQGWLSKVASSNSGKPQSEDSQEWEHSPHNVLRTKMHKLKTMLIEKGMLSKHDEVVTKPDQRSKTIIPKQAPVSDRKLDFDFTEENAVKKRQERKSKTQKINRAPSQEDQNQPQNGAPQAGLSHLQFVNAAFFKQQRSRKNIVCLQ